MNERTVRARAPFEREEETPAAGECRAEDTGKLGSSPTMRSRAFVSYGDRRLTMRAAASKDRNARFINFDLWLVLVVIYIGSFMRERAASRDARQNILFDASQS